MRVAGSGQFPAWLTGILLTAYYWIDLLQLPNTIMLFVLCPILVGLCAWGAGWLTMYFTVQKNLKAEA